MELEFIPTGKLSEKELTGIIKQGEDIIPVQLITQSDGLLAASCNQQGTTRLFKVKIEVQEIF